MDRWLKLLGRVGFFTSIAFVVGAVVVKRAHQLEVVVDATIPAGSCLQTFTESYGLPSESCSDAPTRRQFVHRARDHRLTFLRIDPTSDTATSIVHDVRVRQGARELVWWSPEDLRQWLWLNVTSIEARDDGIVITPSNADPQVIRNGPPIEGEAPGRVSEWIATQQEDALAGVLCFGGLLFLLLEALAARQPHRRRWAEVMANARRLDVAVPVLVFATLMLIHFDFVPVWDGAGYASCVTAAEGGLGRFNCLHYNPYPYMALLLVGKHLVNNAYWGVHLMNLGLGVAAIIAFRRLYLATLGARTGKAGALLPGLLLAVNPLFVISALNTNFDFPAAVAGLAFLEACLARRARWAAVMGLLLCFAKITGAMHYFVFLALFALLSPWLPGRTLSVWEKVLLVVPGLVYTGVHALYKITDTWTLSESVTLGTTFKLLFDMDLTSHRFHQLLAGITILNFSWLLLPPIAAGLGSLVWRTYVSTDTRAAWRRSDGATLLICSALLGSLYVSSRFLHYFNPRYFLFSQLLFVLVGAICLDIVIKRPAVRLGLGALLVTCLVISNFLTVDAVSKKMFGTFKFGDHEMLALGHMDGWPEAGRDQIVYSPEITAVHEVLQNLYKTVRLDASTPVVASPLSDGNHFAYVSTRDASRTAWPSQAFGVFRQSLEWAVHARKDFIVLGEPYFGTEALVDNIPAGFGQTQKGIASHRGYALRWVRLSPDGPQPSAETMADGSSAPNQINR